MRRVRANLEPARQDERRRQDHERDERQPPVVDEERDQRRRQEDHVRDERGEALGEDVRERVDVARQPRDDPARPLFGEVAQRERGQVVEEVAAEAEHDRLPDSGERADEEAGEQPPAEVDERVDDDDVRQEALVVADDAVVDRVADEDPAARLRGCLARGGEHQHCHPQPAPPEVARQPRQTRTTITRHELRLRRGRRTAPCRG